MRLRCSSLHRWGEWGGGWGGGQFSRLWMKPVQQSTSLDGISSSLLQKKSIQRSDGRWSGLPPAGRQRRAAGGGRVYKGYRSQASLSPWVSLARKGSERSGTVSWNCPSLHYGTEPGLYLYIFLQFSPDWMLQVRIEDDVWPTTSEWQLTLSVRADLRTLSAQITAPLARLSSPNPHKEKRTEGKGALTGTSMGRKKVLGFARITRKKSSGEHVRGMRYEPISPGYCTVRNYARVFLVFFFNVVFSFGNTSLTQSTRVTFVLVG